MKTEEIFNISKCLKHLKDISKENKIPPKNKLNIKIKGKYCYVMFESPIEIKNEKYKEVTTIYHNVKGIKIGDWFFGLLDENELVSGEFVI